MCGTNKSKIVLERRSKVFFFVDITLDGVIVVFTSGVCVKLHNTPQLFPDAFI